MKTRNLSLCIGILFYAICGISQVPEVKRPRPEEVYLLRSKQDESIAWIMLGIGTTLMVSGIVIANGGSFALSGPPGQFEGGVGLCTLGVLFNLGSLACFNSASKNKKLAMNAVTYIKMQEVPIELRNTSSQTHIPTATVKFTF